MPASHETFRTRTAKTKIQRESHEVAVSRAPSSGPRERPFLKRRVQTSANRQIPEFAKPDKLLYGTLAFSAEVIAQVHERHTLLGERYVNWPAPFREGGYDPIEGLRKVPANRTWDDIRGRNRKVVVEARDRIPSEEVRQH